MNLIVLAEKGFLPDWLIRIGIRRLLAGRLLQERRRENVALQIAELVQFLKHSPIALSTAEANAQHYEVPAAFFEKVLGPRLKYSSCFYSTPASTLHQAEEAMLRLTCKRAELADGMEVLDLGCGWGSLCLWVAENYRRCRVTALSNSTSQRSYIEDQARARGLSNLRVITANMAEYLGGETFDRILSVEMFEHMRNYEMLLARLAGWLRPAGKLFVHIFCHKDTAYTFDTTGKDDWLARHFFTDGLMPSFDLFGHFNRDLAITRSWQVNGLHYAQTSEHWLQNLDANRAFLLSLFQRNATGPSAQVLLQRWRIFFMACAELFSYHGGEEWFVGHYLFEPRSLPTVFADTVGPKAALAEKVGL